MMDELTAGHVSGLVMEVPIADFFMTTNCDIYDLADQYAFFSYAAMYSKDLDTDFSSSITQSIIKINEQHS